MSSRAEMSPPLQDRGPELTASGGMKVALIGPNEAHRKIVAKALAGSEARSVREFVDYPANMTDLPRMLEQQWDVVMIDVDSDQSYALKLVETIAGMTSAIVMVYSMRNDPDLLMSCMRAGARDFLPLSEAEGQPAPGPQLVQTEDRPAAPPEQHSCEPPVRSAEPTAFTAPIDDSPRNGSAPVPAVRPSVAEPRAAHSLQQDIDAWDEAHLRVPEPSVVRQVPVPEPQPVIPVQPPIAKDPQPLHQPVMPFQPPVREVESQPKPATSSEPAASFDEWDSAFLRGPQPSSNKGAGISPRAAVSVVPRAPQPAPSTAHDQDPRALATAELLARVESEQGSVPADTSVLSASRPKIERPALEPLVKFHYEVPEEERIPDRKWMVWAGIAAAVAVAAGLLVVFLHPFGHSASQVVPQQQAAVQQQAAPAAQAAPVASAPVVTPTAPKPSAAIPAANSSTSIAPAPEKQVQVSSDAMDAQLSAPSRISNSVKAAPAAAEEAPPTGFSAGAIDNNSGVPGAVFGGQNKVQVVAGVHAISSGVADGMLIRKVEPIYPKFAKDSRITGTVVLKATITKAGTIEGLQVLSGPKILSEAALNAVKFWRYRPYMLNDQPVEVQTTINVVFNLNN